MDMNARHYRTEYTLSALDFPAITGPGTSTIDFRTESPVIEKNKLKLKITKTYVLVELYDKKRHDVLSAMSAYEIPITEIKVQEDIYECYKDAIAGLNEAYEYAKKQLPLPNFTFPAAPIETYQKEIDRVFYLLTTLN